MSAPPPLLVGRDGDIESVCGLFVRPDVRLVTLTGAPGIGKTSLARAVGERLASRYPDGVWFVDLGSSKTTAQAIHSVGRAVSSRLSGRDHATALGQSFGRGRCLVVLDCCERLADLGTAMSRVLAAAPNLRLLATSRHRLRVAAEVEYAVPPLAMASPRADVDAIATAPATLAFLAHAARNPSVGDLSAIDMPAVGAICVRLQGIPLALEIAAARLSDYSPEELNVRLHNREILLGSDAQTAGRHHSLRTAISWSHVLLTDAERTFFRRVSVFPSWFTLTAASAVVAAPEIDALAAASVLVAHNLINARQAADGITRYALLDSLREYAAEQLDEHGEVNACRRRHGDYFASVARDAQRGMGTEDEWFWWEWVGLEHANLRVALDHASESEDSGSVVVLGVCDAWYCYTRGELEEPTRIEAILADPAATVRDEDRRSALIASGVLRYGREELERASELLLEARELCRINGDTTGGAIAACFLGNVRAAQGRCAEALALHGEGAVAFSAMGNARGVAWCAHDIGQTSLRAGDLELAKRKFAEALTYFGALSEPWPQAWCMDGLARVAIRQGRTQDARTLIRGAIDRQLLVGDRRGLALCLKTVASLAHADGFDEDAEELSGLVEVEIVHGVRTPERVVAVARGILDREPPAAGDSPLTGRQREIARLIASGCTNRQIGRQLGITEKTVETHVTQMMKRIGASSRAEIAGHAVRSGF